MSGTFFLHPASKTDFEETPEVECPKCRGSGKVEGGIKCRLCQGEGEIPGEPDCW